MANSDVAQALNRLQGMAENFISSVTNRNIQLGREKEARMIDAYNYMVGNEESQIAELETALDAIEQNMLDRGIELKSVKEQYRTMASEELLSAANEGAAEMLQVRLSDSQDYKERLEGRKREASKILRHINLFDDSISVLDPAATGEKHIVEASDVVEAADKFKKEYDQYGPEIEQRLTQLQTEGELERLQEDYYAKLARETEQKLTATQSDFATADLRRQRFEIIKKEAAEQTSAMTINPKMAAAKTFSRTVSLEVEIKNQEDAATGKALNSSELKAKQEEERLEYRKLGVTFYPWAMSEEQAIGSAQNLRQAFIQAGNGKYQALINYLKEGYSQYILWSQEDDKDTKQKAQNYKESVKSFLGIDIDNKKWLQSLERSWNATWRADEEQGEEQVKMGMDMFSEPLIDESDYGTDPLLKEYGFE